MSGEIRVADYIEELRKELLEGMRRGAGKKVRFSVEQAEIELSVEAEAKGEGKLSFKVLGIGAEAGGGGSKTTAQRLTLTLTPVDDKGGRVLVADEASERDL